MADVTELSLEELTERVGISVRNVRFYTSRGLLPPPVRRGRQGFYTADHVARLELVRELQAHGFTLSAIERYLEKVPADASTADVVLHRTMLAPWQAESSVELSRAELEDRAGRDLSDDDLESLTAIGIVRPRGDRWAVGLSLLPVGLSLLDLNFPVDAARASAKVYAKHGRAVAEELYSLFRTMVWPHYKEGDITREQMQAIIEAFKPLSIASLVAAYEEAMDEHRRENIAKRAR